MPVESFPRRFGKYVLLDHLATGGMAEIYIAKVSGVERFERLLAIKCMRSELAMDQEFNAMFVAEAKLAGLLQHANIAQIFELGRHQGQLYIAMELVEGKDLRTILERATETNTPLPVPFAAYVISRAATGLDYAHRKTTPEGQPLNLVHRDISPPNLLLSYEGEVKVVDFGIAKASVREDETRVGVLKGKFSYMAPEQVMGKPLDGRTDIFALGSVLYELCAGHKLFEAESDFEILERVQAAVLPDIRAELAEAPPELISVLLRCLSLNPADRFQYASELAKALEPLLILDRTIFGPQEASGYLASLFRDDINASQQATARLISMVAEPDQVDDDDWSSKTETFHSAFRLLPPTDAVALAREPLSIATTDHAELPVADAQTGLRPQRDQDFWKQPTEQIRMRRNTPRPASQVDTAAALEGDDEQLAASFGVRPPWTWLAGGAGLLVVLVVTWLVWGGSEPPEAIEEPPPPTRSRVAPPPPANSEERETATPPAPSREVDRADYGFVSVRVKGAKDATVSIDGKVVGKAPLNAVRVPVGTRVIKAEGRHRGRKRTRTKRVAVYPKNTRKSPAAVVIQL